MMTELEMYIYDELVERSIANKEEINLCRNIIDGTWEMVFDAIIYARTGYRNFEQYLQAEEEEE